MNREEYIITFSKDVVAYGSQMFKLKGETMTLNSDELNCLWRNGDLLECGYPVSMNDIEEHITLRKIEITESVVKFCYD